MNKNSILKAQKLWGDSLLEIGKAFQEKKDFKAIAQKKILHLYNFENDDVLFKPTLVQKVQFRPSIEGAVSYFVAHDKNFPEDIGFALQGWKAVRFENKHICFEGDLAFAMGNYFFTKESGEIIKVEYTFGYKLDSAGEIRIFLHHSSLPFRGQ
jgi:hypothetical protein